MKSRPVSPALVGLLVVLFASVFLFLSGHGLYRDYQFEGPVGRATATIEDLSKSLGGRGRSSTCEANYSYATSTGVTEEVRVTISPASYYHLHRAIRLR